jgi:hypothetical protein
MYTSNYNINTVFSISKKKTNQLDDRMLLEYISMRWDTNLLDLE